MDHPTTAHTVTVTATITITAPSPLGSYTSVNAELSCVGQFVVWDDGHCGCEPGYTNNITFDMEVGAFINLDCHVTPCPHGYIGTGVPGKTGFGGQSNCTAWDPDREQRAGGYTDIVAINKPPFFLGGPVDCPYGSGMGDEAVPITGVKPDPLDPEKWIRLGGFTYKELPAPSTQCTNTAEGANEDYCSSWCNTAGKWGCGGPHTNGIGATATTCDCHGCNGCPLPLEKVNGALWGNGTNRTSGCTTWDNFTGSVTATIRAPNYYKHTLCGPHTNGTRQCCPAGTYPDPDNARGPDQCKACGSGRYGENYNDYSDGIKKVTKENGEVGQAYD